MLECLTMPSHITHLLFASDVLADSGIEPSICKEHASFIAFGAQGPDIFYHNRRTKPSGLHYGAIMHRRSYGQMTAHMAARLRERRLPEDGPEALFLLAFITHAVLDRYAHPFINYFAGWGNPDGPMGEPGRFMHTFFERIIDTLLLREEEGIWPHEYDFFSRIYLGERFPPALFDLFRHALRPVYDRGHSDALLETRLSNTFADTMGFYRHTNNVTSENLAMRARAAREDPGKLRWVTLVHPVWLPSDIDFLNLSHSRWHHPCSAEGSSTASFIDLINEARTVCVRAVRVAREALYGKRPLFGEESLEEAIGNTNLSDGLTVGHSCRKEICQPLPLLSVVAELIRHVTGSFPGSPGSGVEAF